MEKIKVNAGSRQVLTKNKSQTTHKGFSIMQGDYSTQFSQKSHSNNNRRECDSHFVQLRPLKPNLHFDYTLAKMVHEGDYKPFPVILMEFMKVQMMPMFGLEREIPHYRHKVKKCQEGLQQELSRINHQQFREGLRPQKMMTPLPRHKVCQVCNEQFEDYKDHTQAWKHKRNAKESLGMEYISTTIEQMKMAIEDQNSEEELKCLMDFNLSLEETIPCIRQHYKQFLRNLYEASREK